jgi:hypothetical protein
MFAISGIGYFRPDDQMVTPRQQDIYKLDISQLITSYAFHNQNEQMDARIPASLVSRESAPRGSEAISLTNLLKIQRPSGLIANALTAS